jgi:hypothetical protein
LPYLAKIQAGIVRPCERQRRGRTHHKMLLSEGLYLCLAEKSLDERNKTL